MSYILDALRRAEAQRQQQAATPPGLGSPAVPVVQANPPIPGAASMASRPVPDTAPPSPAPRGGGWMLGIAGTAVVASVMMAVVGLRTPDAPAPRPPAATPPVPAGQPVVPPSPPLADAAPAPILQPVPEPAPATARPTTPPAPATAAAPTTPRTPKPAADAVPRYADLPESVRAALPAISVQGVTWSENPAWRHLIVNGRVLQEGQSIGPDHVLEQIGRDGSVLNHRGQRYRIGH